MVDIQTGVKTTLLHRPGQIPKHDKRPKYCQLPNKRKVLLWTQIIMAKDATVEKKESIDYNTIRSGQVSSSRRLL